MPEYPPRRARAAGPGHRVDKKEPETIDEVTVAFAEAHRQQEQAKSTMDGLKSKFFSMLTIPQTKLARQTVYYDGTDPEQHVATLYPKYQIISKHFDLGQKEWRLVIEEDPEKKTWTYFNRAAGLVFERQVRESAPAVDLARLKKEHPALYRQMTFQPKPPRELKPLDKLDEKQKATLMRYLLPVKLTNAMSKPREPKPEEIDG